MIAAAALALTLVAGGQALELEPCPDERIEPEREFSGVYLDEFEGQLFYEGARSLREIDRRSAPRIWLELDLAGLGGRFGIVRREPPATYRVRFVGERRGRGTVNLLCGYGHLGIFEAEIRVTRLIEIVPLEPPVSSDNPR